MRRADTVPTARGGRDFPPVSDTSLARALSRPPRAALRIGHAIPAAFQLAREAPLQAAIPCDPDAEVVPTKERWRVQKRVRPGPDCSLVLKPPLP